MTSTTTPKAKEIVKLLVEAYKDDNPSWRSVHISSLPWFKMNKDGDGPLSLAIREEREELALYIMSLHERNYINDLLDIYKSKHKILFLAIEKKCFAVAKHIITRLDKKIWTEYLTDDKQQNVLHLAPSFTGNTARTSSILYSFNIFILFF